MTEQESKALIELAERMWELDEHTRGTERPGAWRLVDVPDSSGKGNFTAALMDFPDGRVWSCRVLSGYLRTPRRPS